MEKWHNWADYWNYGDFCSNSQLWRINAELFLRKAGRIVEFRKNDSILNIGCGPGYLEALLAPIVKNILAVDISKKFINLTKERCKNYNNVQTTLLSDNYTELNIYGKSFSLILCISVVQYYSGIGEIEGLIAAAQKVALPGARMLIADLPIKRGKPGFLWDALCSCLMSIRGGYIWPFLNIVLDVYRHRFLHQSFYEENTQLYFTSSELESLIQRMGLNAKIIRENLSVYANRLNLLIYF